MFDKADAESDAVELKAAEDAKVTVELAALADQAAKEAEEDAAATAAEEAAEAAKHAMEAAVKARDDALIAKRLEEEAAEKAQEEAKAARLAEEVALEKQEEATKAAQLTQEICNQKTAFSRTQIADSEMKEAIAQAAEADVKAMEEEAKEAAILACEWAEEEAAAEAEAKAEAERLAREEEQRRKEAECLTGDGRREGNVRTTPTSAKYSRLSGPGCIRRHWVCRRRSGSRPSEPTAFGSLTVAMLLCAYVAPAWVLHSCQGDRLPRRPLQRDLQAHYCRSEHYQRFANG